MSFTLINDSIAIDAKITRVARIIAISLSIMAFTSFS
jgi:hypothetical protein